MKINRLILTLAVALCLSVAAVAAPGWETVSQPDNRELVEPDDLSVAVRDGAIYVTTGRPVSVKVYTVLGQLVNSSSLPAGTSRLRMPTRGIYIVKIGTITRRVTL